jgi:tripartite-type tricarboxylate transporter receptor subunit TctC
MQIYVCHGFPWAAIIGQNFRMSMKIRHLLMAAVLALVNPVCSALPDKPVRFVVGFAPGGSIEILNRIAESIFGRGFSQRYLKSSTYGGR